MTQDNPTIMRRIRGVMFKLPLMITCETFEEFILAYLEGELPPRQKFVFDLHLKVCPECRSYLKAYKASLELARLSGEDADMVPDDVPEDLVAAVVAARDC